MLIIIGPLSGTGTFVTELLKAVSSATGFLQERITVSVGGRMASERKMGSPAETSEIGKLMVIGP